VSSPVVLHMGKVSGISGAENHLLLLLPALRREGIDARFLLLHEDEPGAWELARRLDEARVPVEGVRLPRALSPLALRRVVAVVRRHRPTIVHTHLVHADFYGLTAARLARVPVRASTKHGFNDFRASRGFAAADRAVARDADPHIAISRGLARYLSETEGFAESRFSVVHYGIDAGPDPPPPGDSSRLVCVGRLVAIKGHETLLRAFAHARAQVPELELDIVGEGPLDTHLRRCAAELVPAGAVRFRGRLAPVQSAYEEAAIVVVPSLGEGFGMVALEAMERGRPVIASNVGGLPEIVADGRTGLLVPPAEARPLADAIVALASDEARAATFGAEARLRATSLFTQDRCTQRTVALYGAALGRAGLGGP
jgi:glycosyltransferase involved in cell wall biosynthesis